MEKSVIDNISYIPQMDYIYAGWRNGKVGAITNDGNGFFRFIEYIHDEQGHPNKIHDKIEDNPIVVHQGIVAYWLRYRKNNNRILPSIYKIPVENKSVLEMFEDYTTSTYNGFKEEYRDNPVSWKWDWEYEFYAKFIIPYEMYFNKQSEALFEYLPDEDKEIIQSVMDNYIEFLKTKRTEKGFIINDELKVLRAIDKMNEYMLEDMENFEVEYVLEKLEKEGYIQVAYTEGHEAEDFRILNKGKVYLKQMEENVKNKQARVAPNVEPNHNNTNSLTVIEVNNSDSTPNNKLDRQIDIERLKKHFKIPFVRNGFETLVSVLTINHDSKWYAKIANQIYKSDKFQKSDFNTFSSWYRAFCEIVGCKYCESYKPSKLKLTKEEEASFFFLK